MSKESKLQQTKGSFKIAGIVRGINDEKALNQGVIKSGLNEGRNWRSLRFRVATSPINQVPVEIFGSEQESAYIYNFDQKKTTKVPFEQRDMVPKGCRLFGTSVSLQRNAKGNLERETYVDYDAVEHIYNQLNDGDSVYVSGEIQFSKYTSERTGETIPQVKYIIKNISLTRKPVDFENEKFEELASFEHEIVIVDTMHDPETNKVYVTANIINYGDKVETAQFTIDPAESPAQKKLASSFLRRLKYGDWVKVFGRIINAIEEVQLDTTDDDWGGEMPAGYGVGNRVVRELRITGVDSASYEPKKYTEEDFALNSFTTSNDNPFDADLEEDDLPF